MQCYNIAALSMCTCKDADTDLRHSPGVLAVVITIYSPEAIRECSKIHYCIKCLAR